MEFAELKELTEFKQDCTAGHTGRAGRANRAIDLYAESIM